jgi:pimeloyl-ACP methyl ester carboxylesterase
MYGENTVEFDAQVSVEEMEQFLPEGSPVLCLKDAQHHLMLDQPEEFIKELDLLIQKLT